MLLIAFTVLPAPTGPTWKMFGPMARSTGRTRSSTAGSPPTMIASVRRARAAHPAAHRRLEEVHAARLRPRLDLARRRRQHAAEVDETSCRASRARPGRRARGTRPRRRASAGRQVSTISQRSTTSRAEAARLAPASIEVLHRLGRACRTPSSERRPSARCPPWDCPCCPTPMNPTVAVISVLHVSASLCGE
mgnify:CR=1 FL=1